MNVAYALEHSVDFREQVRSEPFDVTDRVVDPESIVERYREARLALHIHTSTQRGVRNGHVEQWCLDLERVIQVDERIDALDQTADRLSGDLELSTRCTPEGQVDIPVFVRVGQSFEPCEWVVGGVVPTRVRLVPPSDCLMYGVDAGDSPSDLGVELRERFADGELYLSLLPGFEVRSGAVLEQLPSDVVEGGPEVVNGVAENRAEEVGRILNGVNDADNSAVLWVQLHPRREWLGLSLEVGFLLSLKSLSVFPRPVQLDPGAFQIRVGHDA